jgi:signal transduction histidine kinase
LLSDIFEEAFEVIVATEGLAALELALERKPDLILLDVMMPGMNGYEVCRRLKADSRTSNSSVIFITGLGNVADETRGLELGAVDYVTKPFNPAAVRARVNNQIKLRNAQAQLVAMAAAEHSCKMAAEIERSEEMDRMRRRELQQKDDFISHVSHELRSPLASIYSFSTIIADGLAGETTPQQNEYLQIVLRNVDQLKAMIEDLLHVTRDKSAEISVELQPFPVSEAIVYALQTLAGAAKSKRIEVSFDAAPELPAVYADPMRLRQILIILVDNAIKFTPVGGQVIVRVGLCNGDLRTLLLEVADTGCGIGIEMVERIFERLYQVDPSDHAGRRGLGLGLHIAKDLVTRQGGLIWVESCLQAGSQFFFTLPVASPLDRYVDTRNAARTDVHESTVLPFSKLSCGTDPVR